MAFLDGTRDDRGVQVVIDPQEWYRLKKELDSFDPELARALRKRIRNAGNLAKEEVQKTLRLPSPDGGDDSGEGRAALAAATRVSVSFGKKAAGAKIITSSSKLPAENRGLLHVYNKESFRHPVYGNENVWVAQKGRPYFGAVITRMIGKAIQAEVHKALDDAMKAIGARGV